jgi:hypothetical protein
MNYQAARSELIERIRLRDYVLMIYLIVVGTIMSISFGKQSNMELLLSIPFFALACVILVSQHNNVIGTLIEYIACDIRPELEKKSEYTEFFVCSNAFLEHSSKSNRDRSIGHGTIMIGPCVVSLGVNYNHAYTLPWALVIIWYISLGLTIASGWIVCKAYKRRRQVYKKIRNP